MGLKVIRIFEYGEEARLGEVVGMPNCAVRIAFLQSREHTLELFEYQKPHGKPIPGDDQQANHGFIHVGFQSTDIQADCKRLKEHGIKFFNDPIELRPDTWVVYFHGPDNEVIELKQTALP